LRNWYNSLCIDFMSSKAFRFKQFNVAQDKCAMKVNTDGVLLAAWAHVNTAKTILDIGTGTGVLAMMMKQKNIEATVDAIDIDEDAYQQAKENFAASEWHHQLQAYHCALQKFTISKKYDVIISNPPYFIDDLKTENHQKNIAKHNVALTYTELLIGIQQLLNENGNTFIAIPSFNYALLMHEAEKRGLFVNKKTDVSSIKGKTAYLTLVQLSWQKNLAHESTLAISESNNTFTNEYIALTKDFYLKF